mmetsp:Transcript_93647/g.303149  ORF Transcript_93647/g.303149 Transcript_93647/m.303149 type:complete len:263 (-) Transcript_93647:45-833(-)
MDSFPLVVHRRHFKGLRSHVITLYGGSGGGAETESVLFDRAYMAYLRQVFEASRAPPRAGPGECPSFHSMMGSYLWWLHRRDYVWSIRHGHLTDVPLRHTCPRLRVAQHVAYWGRETWFDQVGYPWRHLKVNGRPTQLSEVAYGARATAAILAGLCAVPWVGGPESGEQGLVGADGIRRAFAMGVNESWLPLDPGLRDLNRDLCTHGMGLAEGVAAPEDRLLSRTYPGMRWTVAEAAYCGGLRPDRLRLEYRQLMARFVFAP